MLFFFLPMFPMTFPDFKVGHFSFFLIPWIYGVVGCLLLFQSVDHKPTDTKLCLQVYWAAETALQSYRRGQFTLHLTESTHIGWNKAIWWMGVEIKIHQEAFTVVLFTLSAASRHHCLHKASSYLHLLLITDIRAWCWGKTKSKKAAESSGQDCTPSLCMSMMLPHPRTQRE